MLIDLLGEFAQLLLEFSGFGWTRQEPSDHREPKPCPTLPPGKTFVPHRAPPRAASPVSTVETPVSAATVRFYPSLPLQTAVRVLRELARLMRRPRRSWSPALGADGRQAGEQTHFWTVPGLGETADHLAQRTRRYRRPQAPANRSPGSCLWKCITEVGNPSPKGGTSHAEELLQPAHRDSLGSPLAKSGHDEHHSRPVDPPAPKEHRGRKHPAAATSTAAAKTQADRVGFGKVRRAATGLTLVSRSMQRSSTVGQPWLRVDSAKSRSRVWRRENRDFRWRTSARTIAPAFHGQEPPYRFRQENARGLHFSSLAYLVQIRSDFHHFPRPRSSSRPPGGTATSPPPS
jgi:hypothetical protein